MPGDAVLAVQNGSKPVTSTVEMGSNRTEGTKQIPVR
jgi:hypothetical protein